MPRDFLPIGEMQYDYHGHNENGAWLVMGLLGRGTTYESIGPPVTVTEIAGTDSGNPMGVFVWKTGYATSKTFYTTSSAIYEDGVSVKTGLGTPYYGTYFAPFGPDLFMTNGSTSNPIQKRNQGTGAWADITIPTHGATIYPKFLITFRNQLIAANIVTSSSYGALAAGNYKHLVWWSSRGNGEQWGTDLDAPEFDGSNYIPIFDDSYEITGLAAGESCVFVFKEHAIYRLDGPDYAVTPISLDVGCVHPKSIVKVAGKIYFMAQSGLWSIDSASGSLENLSIGAISTLWGGGGGGVLGSAPAPPAHTADTIDIAFPIGTGIANRLTMAADVENRILCALYKNASAVDGYWNFMFYSIDTKQFSFHRAVDNDTFTFEETSYPMVYTRVRTTTTGDILSTIGVATKGIAAPNTNEHRLGRLLRIGHRGNDVAYVLWPFKFYDPDKRVAIRSVRPVFRNLAYSTSTHALQKTIATVQVHSVIKPNLSYVSGGEYTAEGGRDAVIWGDMNVVIPDCPFADSHAIALQLSCTLSDAGSLYIAGFSGIEVEWEEDVKRSA